MHSQTSARTPINAKSGFRKKSTLFASAGAGALLMASQAYAQEQPAAPIESVTVSSSRIMTAGFNAPTPTTVIGSDFIQNQAKDNIFSVVQELPSLMGSTGVQNGVNGTSGGTNGLLSFNLFGLGTIRTLTLLDGERFIPANVTGVPDISEFPQLLIQRVDVVTGGASASWGSDAVAGVVNFVTDKKFVGFKANISTGLSTYGDNATATFQAAAGTSFAGGRGHFEVAGEFSHMDGVQGGWQQLSCCGGSLTNSLSGGRTWFIEATRLQYGSPAATPAGQPQYFNTANGQQNQLGRYGLINSGPLAGVAFGPNGTTYGFNYGTGAAGVNIATGLGGTAQGVPDRTLTGGSPSTPSAVKNCIVNFCIGGENDGQTGSGVTLAIPLTRADVYTRMSYDLTPNAEVFLTMNWSQVGTSNIPNPDAWLGQLPGIAGGANQGTTPPAGSNAFNNTNPNYIAILTSSVPSSSTFNPGQILQAPGIQCGNAPGGPNAFLPASVNNACIANNVNSFSYGSLFYGLGPQVVYTQRDNRRLVGGADGNFNLFETDWNWQTYYEHGENDTNIHVRGITLKPYLYAAIDSVSVTAANQATYPSQPLGTIVCRSAVADAEGCVPFNPFGAPISQAQKNWLYGGNNWGPGPTQISHQMQDAFDFSLSGAPISDWAGKISVATGAAWRQEAYDVRGDGAGNGTIAGSGGAPGSPCNDPLLNCLNGTNWYAGSFHNGQGNYHVLEGFLEFNIPLLNTPDWGNANLNIAGRHARYSTAGDSNTWKVGLNWDTPVDGLRLRAMQSRDVRAPNLSELFAAPVTANGSSNIPANAGNPATNIQVIQGTLGNPLLKPERSLNTQLGVVLQPSWLQGWQISLDYYRLYVAGEITTVPQQTNVNNCFAGITTYCSAIVTTAGTTPFTYPPQWLQVNTQFFNVASVVTDGFNLETSYQFSLSDWDVMPIPGSFTLRALATYVDKFITNPGVPGGIVVNSAGANDVSSSNTPHVKGFFVQTYNGDNWQLTLSENWISQGRHNLNYIQCAAGSCPVPTLANPTINDNHVPGIIYFDLGGSYNINEHWQIYTQIDNLLNKSPPPEYDNSQNPNSDGANPFLYDVIGRMFHVGVRIND
ncbi:MAG TPA: TonB-dependent receptor [Rhizomicrobium sp.]|nr:TonB-dependent receptor [Rhizomicrobium sp.]